MERRSRVALPPALGGAGVLQEVTPVAIVRQDGPRVVYERAGSVERCADLVPALERALREAGLGARAIGFLSYEHCRRFDPLVAVVGGESPVPDAWWAVLPGSGAPTHAGAWRAERGTLSVSLDDDRFRSGVDEIRARIAAGDVYQVNLTRRWTVSFAGDPAGLFAELARSGGPRFATYLEDRELGFAVLCLSPELLLSRRGATVETRPIKGTRPRAGDPERALAELRASAKDAAELAMIVDLERNDLNRVCRPGSVRVSERAGALATADVVHLEACVAGELEEGVGWPELLAALLPGGSVTGAPKLAACRMIAALEPVPRGVYCGALGVVQANGDGVLALPIRTGVVADGRLDFHSGCGIVWDSDPHDEEAESRAKVRSWLEALGAGGE